MLHFIKRDGKQYRNFYFIYYYFSLPSTLLNVSSAIFVYFSSIASAFLFNSSAYSLSAMDFEHVCRGHMELETTLEFLKVNKSMDLRNVVLLHLSDDNSDAELFAARAKEVVGMADVYVADEGMEVELNKDPF